MSAVPLGPSVTRKEQQIRLTGVQSDFAGFSSLARLHSQLQPIDFASIAVDLSGCSWFDANMCAALGAVFARSTDNLNLITLLSIPRSIEAILAKNRFLDGFGYPSRHDTYATTIPYRRFSTAEERYFAEYLNLRLRGRGLPQMTPALSRRFKDSILELFVNAAMHSETELGIFVCGQFYPNKKRLDFCIADAGIGIRRKIQKELGIKMNSDQAIEWALQEGHTTRTGNIPGGLGLKLIREFIAMNAGRIQIVSDRGYWESHPQGEVFKRMDLGFPGTVINIEINTADTGRYCLAGEHQP